MKIELDLNKRVIFYEGENIKFDEPEGFELLKHIWLQGGWDAKYVYSWTWLGRPIIQLPDDMMRLQEVIYRIKPTLIIETGIAHGGSLIFSASLLKLLGKGRVIGIDIDIRSHNRKAIETHELSPLITLIEGSSIANEVIDRVAELIGPNDKVFVILDSNHTKAHVLEELRLYGNFVSIGSYLVATDGIMQDLAAAPRSQADWDINNPQQAVLTFLKENEKFLIDNPKPVFNESKVETHPTYWPNAWLRRVR